jgi:Cu/Ag efflux protein CusF
MRQSPASPPAAPAVPTPVVSGTIGEQAVTVTAKVKKVDLKMRRVTLERADGESFTMTAGDAVKNLAQVKAGDSVVATYYESLAYEVKKPGDAVPGVVVGAGGGSAKPGEKPAGLGARVTTVTATITGIDKKTQMVTLTGPDGDVVSVKARNPANLDKVKIGDLVEITYTEALAISVEPAKK